MQDSPDKVTSLEESARKNVVVASKRSSYLKHPAVKGAMVLLVVLIVIALFSGHHSKDNKKVEPKSETPIDHQDSHSILQANLAQLAKLNQNKPVVAVNSAGEVTETTEAEDKATLARQNAPTNMFAGGGDNIVSNQSQTTATTSTTSTASNSNSGAIFAGQGSFASFGNQAMDTTAVQATKIAHPEYTIASGEFIHAVLETGINSDLPGMVRAIVSQPVYSYTGESTLIPAGSRLIGQYNSGVMAGQSRVMVMWNRIMLPNGVSVQLNSPGSDSLGLAGQNADSIDTHFWARFGEATLLSIMGATTANADVAPTDGYNSASSYRMAMAQSFQQAASQSVQQNQAMKPTLVLNQGAAINVFVAHDLDFYNAMQLIKHG